MRDLILISYLIILIFSPCPGSAQESFRSGIYSSYISGDMNRWESLIKATPAPVRDAEALYEYALSHYGFIGFCMAKDEKGKARDYFQKTSELSARLVELRPADPRFVALEGALYGFQMAFKPHLMPVIGPKSLKALNRALELGPTTPQALIESGNKDWFMPAVFGGSKERAMKQYETALSIMGRDEYFTKGNWYFLHSQMILAGWYEEMGLHSRARGIYLKIIGIEPEFMWAMEKLGARE